MPSLRFEGLPAYAFLGGPISGTLLLDSNKPVEATQVQLTFRGSEVSRIDLRRNKQELTYQQTVPFLEQSIPFDPASLDSGDDVRRIRFEVVVPPNGPTSLQTGRMPPIRAG